MNTATPCVILPYMYNKKSAKGHKKNDPMNPDSPYDGVQSCYCLKPFTGITCRRTEDSVLTLLRWISRKVLAMHCTFSLANISFPHSSFLCHLIERLVSFSLRVFAQMWAARTLWHAWGLPMRLDGDSDTMAWPMIFENHRGWDWGWKGMFSTVQRALSVLLNCCSALMFVFCDISDLVVLNRDEM